MFASAAPLDSQRERKILSGGSKSNELSEALNEVSFRFPSPSEKIADQGGVDGFRLRGVEAGMKIPWRGIAVVVVLGCCAFSVFGVAACVAMDQPGSAIHDNTLLSLP